LLRFYETTRQCGWFFQNSPIQNFRNPSIIPSLKTGQKSQNKRQAEDKRYFITLKKPLKNVELKNVKLNQLF